MRVVMTTRIGRFKFCCALACSVWLSPLPQVMFDLYLRHMRLATAAGVHIIPKHHLALHLWDRAAVTGNPKEFAIWYDEHLNATLAACSCGESCLPYNV